MQLDLSKWAVIAHKDDSGFGRQAQDIRAVLGIERQIVIPSERLIDKPLNAPAEVMLKPSDPVERVQQIMSGLQGIIFFERHNWHTDILPVARHSGIASICIPNWEWFNGHDSQWDLCDLFVTSSEFALGIIKDNGRQNSIHLPWPIDLSKFSPRSISGPARLFIHNAGIVDHDDRKGTRDTINAFKRVQQQDVKLIVRMQQPAKLPDLDHRIEVQIGNLPDPANLYAQGDVAIQPSKMEGNGFMVLEPVCSGMPVITLDYPPMSEFVRQATMRVRKRWFKRKAFPTTWVKHAHLRLPDSNDLAKKIEWCANHDMGEIANDNLRWAQSTFDPQTLKQHWYQVMDTVINERSNQRQD